MISKSCKYAIRAAVYIASKEDSNTKLSVKEIAKGIEAPEAFTAKVLQALNKHRIVTSMKGPYGGFYSEKPQLKIPIIDIVNAIDGPYVFKECVLGLHQCSDSHPCPMHHQYAKTRGNMLKSFQETTINSLAKNLKNGSVYINNSII